MNTESDLFCRRIMCKHAECEKHPNRIPKSVPVRVAQPDVLGCCEYEEREPS